MNVCINVLDRNPLFSGRQEDKNSTTNIRWLLSINFYCYYTTNIYFFSREKILQIHPYLLQTKGFKIPLSESHWTFCFIINYYFLLPLKKKKKNNINLHLTVSSKSSKLFHPNASSPWTTRRDKSREYQIILYAYRGFHLSTAGPKSAWQRIWKERCSNRGCALQPWCMLQLVRAKGWCVASEICHPDVNQYFEGFAVGRPLNPLFWLSLTRNPTPCPACSALPTRRVPLADQRTDSCRWLPFSFPPPVLVFSQPPSQRWLISTRKLIRWEENLAACVDVAVQWSTPTDGKTAVD